MPLTTTWLIGDTSFDIEMAIARRGVRPIGVNWGYHPVDVLREAAGAEIVLERFEQLLELVDEVRG